VARRTAPATTPAPAQQTAVGERKRPTETAPEPTEPALKKVLRPSEGEEKKDDQDGEVRWSLATGTTFRTDLNRGITGLLLQEFTPKVIDVSTVPPQALRARQDPRLRRRGSAQSAEVGDRCL
jgi:hypothetical protein